MSRESRGTITDFRITEGYVHCSRCGKRCSPDLRSVAGEHIVVRAWVECPECIADAADPLDEAERVLRLIADEKTDYPFRAALEYFEAKGV